ncbi:MAG: hypothetical protein Kow0059_06500 [Candidatus Sumerlaeia bacterium]
MSRLLILGTGPLLEAGVRMIGGQCLRTWHFVQPLRAAGHDVILYTVPIPDRSPPGGGDSPLVVQRRYRDFDYQAFAVNDPARLVPVVEAAIADRSPDALIGVNTFPAFVLAAARSRLPMWADLNGWHLVEGHVHAVRQQTDDFLGLFWDRERTVVRRADAFSTVSERQRLALLGELAFCGRLGRRAAGHEFAHTVPNAVNEMLVEAMAEAATAPPEARGPLVPEDAFIVLWSGGFNAWTDVRMLFEGLSAAMRACPSLQFISTGGAVEGFDERTYAEFQALVADSPLRERFHLLGWIDAARLPRLYYEADVGLNADAPNYETLFGARNRLTNMMACGLCPCTTLGTEIAEAVRDHDLGVTFAGGSAAALSDALLAAFAAGREKRREWGRRAAQFARREYSYETTTRPLLQWAARPVLAPDNAEKALLAPGAGPLDAVTLNAVERFMARPLDLDVEQLLQDAADLRALRAKPLYRLWKAFRRLLSW